MYIFIDESGSFSKNSKEEYFVVCSFTVGDPKRTEKKFRGLLRRKFPRKLRLLPEVKFSNKGIDNKLRLKTIQYLADLDVRIRYSYFHKKNVPDEYLKKGKLKSGILYANVIESHLESYLPISSHEFRAFCDKRHLKGMKRSEFREGTKAGLLPKLPSGTLVQIDMIDSTESCNIQIADWLVGAIACYLEGKPLGGEYYEILRNIIDDGQELFKSKYK